MYKVIKGKRLSGSVFQLEDGTVKCFLVKTYLHIPDKAFLLVNDKGEILEYVESNS